MSTPYFVSRYRPAPETVSPRRWADVADFSRNAVLEAVDIVHYSDDQTRAYLGYVARLASYVHHICGRPLTYEDVFTQAAVHNLFEFHVDAGARARGSRRSMLESIGRYLNPAGFPLDVEVRYGYEPPAGPYTQAEVRALHEWSRSQGDAGRNADARMILALGLGAGLRASEIMSTVGSHVTREGEAVIVLPRGYRNAGPRRTVVTADFEEDVLRRAEQVGQDGHLFRPDSENRTTSVLTTFMKRTHADRRIRPDTRRLRSTWIVDHILEGLPAAVIVEMAGLADLQHYRAWVQRAGAERASLYVERSRRLGQVHGLPPERKG